MSAHMIVENSISRMYLRNWENSKTSLDLRTINAIQNASNLVHGRQIKNLCQFICVILVIVNLSNSKDSSVSGSVQSYIL